MQSCDFFFFWQGWGLDLGGHEDSEHLRAPAQPVVFLQFLHGKSGMKTSRGVPDARLTTGH